MQLHDKHLELGQGALIAKLDIQSAYWIVPVHPDDRWLLGMKWRDRVYIDTVLSFGLRSAPKVFNALADSLEWILHDMGVEHTLHYLDDLQQKGNTVTYRPPQPCVQGDQARMPLSLSTN